jgi:hypothetical protein
MMSSYLGFQTMDKDFKPSDSESYSRQNLLDSTLIRIIEQNYTIEFLSTERRCVVFPVKYKLNL